MNVLQWIASTIAVLTLILLMGRAARWMLARGAFESGPCGQLAQWRVAADASVRAIRVFDQVHLIMETRRHATTLDSFSVAEFEAKMAAQPAADRPAILRLFPLQRNAARPKAVAK
jgi:hypothetical protein